MSWDEIHGIMERAVRRGLKRRQAEPIPKVGIDEKMSRKERGYLTLVNDLERSGFSMWTRIASSPAWVGSGRA